MAQNNFLSKPGRFGVQPAMLHATIAAGTNSLTANSDTTYYVPTPYRKVRFSRATSSATTVPVDSDGTVTAIVYKVSSGTTSTALTAALDLEALTALIGSKFTAASTLTEAQRRLAEGDVLKVVVSNNSASIDTQPVDLKFVIETEVLE